MLSTLSVSSLSDNFDITITGNQQNSYTWLVYVCIRSDMLNHYLEKTILNVVLVK